MSVSIVRAWDVFVSHASEDKDAVAIPLARALKRGGLRVWLDRQELRLGDSLIEKINEGLANSCFGVVVLSPSFLAKGWPRRELDGLFAMEEVAERKAILPIWHQIDKATLARHSPILADRLAIDTAEGIEFVASKIIEVVTEAASGAPSEIDPTPLRLLVHLLDTDPARSDVVDFLKLHPRVVRRAFRAHDLRWSTAVGPGLVDLCGSTERYTTNEATWQLVEFLAPNEHLFVGPDASPSLIELVTELREIRRWIAGNLQEARSTLPRIGNDFQGVVVAGRRQRLSTDDVERVRRYNDALPGITVRTYDWIIDAAAEES